MYIKYFHNKKETPYNVFLFSISKTVTFPQATSEFQKPSLSK